MKMSSVNHKKIQLTTNAAFYLAIAEVKECVVQVVYIKKADKTLMYKLFLSDGEQYIPGITHSNLYNLITGTNEKKIVLKLCSFVKIHGYQCINKADGRKLIIITSLSIVAYAPGQVGTPTSINDRIFTVKKT